jgi:HK97 family phage major capsid protein
VPTEIEPRLKSNKLVAWDLIGYVTVSNQLVEDEGGAGEAALFRLFADAATWELEQAFLNGTGADGQMPLGVLACPALKAIARAGGGHIAQADIAGLVAALLPASWKSAIWACSPSCLGDVVKVSGFVLNQAVESKEGYTGMLLGRPLFVTDKLPSLGTKGDLLLFDPKLYTVGMRQDVRVDTDKGLGPGFTQQMTQWRVWLRADGKPQLSSPITLANGDSCSAYCCLAT